MTYLSDTSDFSFSAMLAVIERKIKKIVVCKLSEGSDGSALVVFTNQLD